MSNLIVYAKNSGLKALQLVCDVLTLTTTRWDSARDLKALALLLPAAVVTRVVLLLMSSVVFRRVLAMAWINQGFGLSDDTTRDTTKLLEI